MMAFLGLLGRKRHERAGFALYTAAVRAARDPHYYAELGVPDTMDGRFDMIGLHALLLIGRLQAEEKPGPELAQAVFDAMFLDMDQTLRELGVGDMTVGRRVKAMWEALHGRAQAYAAPLEDGDRSALAAAVSRNVWRGAAPDGGPDAVAAIALRQRAHLLGQPLQAFVSGEAMFLSLEMATA